MRGSWTFSTDLPCYLVRHKVVFSRDTLHVWRYAGMTEGMMQAKSGLQSQQLGCHSRHDLVVIGLLYKGQPNGCQHRFANPAQTKALTPGL